jgi:DNA topoisomerase-2
VSFTVTFTEGHLAQMEADGTLEKKLKLRSSKFSTSNMHAFNAQGVIKKYNSAAEILQEFYELRLEYYAKRKVINNSNHIPLSL